MILSVTFVFLHCSVRILAMKTGSVTESFLVPETDLAVDCLSPHFYSFLPISDPVSREYLLCFGC